MKMLEDATAYNFLQEQKIVVVAQFAKYATPENQVISTLSDAKTERPYVR